MKQLWIVFSLMATLLFASAQIQIGIQLDRDQFLLYEPIPVKLTILNNTGSPLTVSGDWLSFMVTLPDGSGIRKDNKLTIDPLQLDSGSRKTITINITPLYSIRDVGQYLLQGVVEIQGVQYVTHTVAFNVANGQKIWSESRPVGGVQRIYSLYRFSPTSTNTQVFIRVEEPDENKVYATYSLGDIVSFIQPEIKFDKEGNLHVLHPKGQGVYQYSRIALSGKLEHTAEYHATSKSRPALTIGEDGLVMVQGGQSNLGQPKRTRLSQGQKLLTTEAKEALAPKADSKEDPKAESSSKK
ncbi:MAG: hypothetical protein V4507_10165 [Verrucomicrobiota bacterium]